MPELRPEQRGFQPRIEYAPPTDLTGGGGVKWETRVQMAGQLNDPEAYKLALEATEAALRVAMDTGEIEEYRRIKAARDSILAKITTEPEMASGPETVPISEKEARLFFRKRAREIVRIASSPGDLTLKAVYDKVGASLGFDPKKGFAARDLFPRELGSKLDEVKTAVEAEIELRCLLRAAEIKEGALKGMDRSSAAETFVNDMKANNVPVLERSHYK